MDWNLKIKKTQEAINALDKDKIHVLFFDYNFSFHNIWHSPLLALTKLLSAILRTPSIDHVCHISRFIPDAENFIANIFEAGMARGMEENDLLTKLKNMDGKCYIHTFQGPVDKDAAREFEKEWLGIPYSKELAFYAGVDIWEKVLSAKNKSGAFCSYLEATFWKNQKIAIDLDPIETTPADLFSSVGKAKLFYNSDD